MDPRTPLELANDNTARYWLAQAEAFGWRTRVRPEYAMVRCVREDGEFHQVLLVRPPEDASALREELLALFREWDTRRLRVEDPYGVLDLRRYGCEPTLGMPVMVRQPGGGAAPGGPVERVVDAAGLAEAEQVVVDGFPVPDRQPWRPGAHLSPGLLEVPGWRAWLTRRQGSPAGACVTFDDGAAVGLYWVAVLPEHRSRGLGRTLLDTVRAAYPDRALVLTSTLLGEPLYRAAGFAEVSEARWWRYPGLVMP